MSQELFKILKERFEKNMSRHVRINWADVQKKLEENQDKINSLEQMESTGGEPDVVGFENGEYIFIDCSVETPKGRTNVCYDQPALESRKNFKPKDSAMHMAEEMGIEMLTEDEYRNLQSIGEFDLKTSSWLKTPENIRKLGGALFADRRFDTVFVYHNGAESYYGVRGFRGSLRV